MPSVRYYNQTAPFWDFVANLEDQGWGNGNREGSNDSEQPNPWAHPWAQQGWAGFPFGGPFAHRGRGGPFGHAPGPEQDNTNNNETTETANAEHEEEKEREAGPSGAAGPSEPRGPPPPFSEHAHRGRCGGRGRGGWGGRGRGGPHRHGHGPGTTPGGGFGNLGALAQLFQDQLFASATTTDNTSDDKPDDFRPSADVFDTPTAFHIHLSLPGAKKEDVGVSWDAEKSELRVAGVVYRPGVDEAMSGMLALGERKEVGAFERGIRLGSRANPALVDGEGIAARMEDGVLRVEVPKLGEAGFVEVRKVDVE